MAVNHCLPACMPTCFTRSPTGASRSARCLTPPMTPVALLPQEVARAPASPFVMNFVGDVNHLPATSQVRV